MLNPETSNATEPADSGGVRADHSASNAPPPRLLCREIEVDDIDAVVALFGRGFPERTSDYWRRGLARYAAQPHPEDCPKWGYVMTSHGRIVGAVLTLFAPPGLPGASGPRCNLSSWYVEPGFRLYATLLSRLAMRRRDTTFTNISAAPHTFAIHEARGFRRSSNGQFAFVPLLARRRPGHSVRAAAEADALDGLAEAERRLLIDHAGYGCICVVGHDGTTATPFIFIRHPVYWLYWRLGFSPLHYLQVIYCRSSDDLIAYARPLGAHLFRRHGAACVMIDADGPIPGLSGRYLPGMGARIKRGPDPVGTGNLSYSEMVIFGP